MNLSFSSDVRNELCALPFLSAHCQQAELSALLHTAGQFTEGRVTLQSEHMPVAQRYMRLLQQFLQIGGVLLSDKHIYGVSVDNPTQAARIRKAAGYQGTDDTFSLDTARQCCKRAYIRGCFMACGTVSDPEKTYHLEFALPPSCSDRLACFLTAWLQAFSLHPRSLPRKTQTVIYLKEAENIVDLLNIMGAHRSLLRLENVRVVKEMRNAVNRQVNFETANLNKTVNAAVQQVADIRYIAEQVGLGYLSAPLEEAARLRLNYEDASLKEIGAMLSPPVGKSGVNHRLRKISEIANILRMNSTTSE